MSDTQAPNSATNCRGSLWTTPASKSACLEALKKTLVDPTVTAEEIREALDAAKQREVVFSGRVSDELLRASLD